MKHTKIMALALAALLILALAACAQQAQPEPSSEAPVPADTAAPTETAAPQVLEELELVNLKGDRIRVQHLENGEYRDSQNGLYTFDGTDTWLDENGAEWNRPADAACTLLVNAKGDGAVVFIQEDGTYQDAAGTVYLFDGAETWTDTQEGQWNRALMVDMVNLKGDTMSLNVLEDGSLSDNDGGIYTFDGVDTWVDENGTQWNLAVN